MKCIDKTTSIEYCPYCRTSRTMGVTIMPSALTAEDGTIKVIAVKTYHCESCRSFVRSREEEPAPA
jgi:hypothetical protein